jgi:folate-binding protein YgfZ
MILVAGSGVFCIRNTSLPEFAAPHHCKPLEINAENARMHKAFELTALPDLAVVRVRGPDAAKFLQGQISNDVARLGAGRSLLAGYHNPQGRVIAVLRMARWDAGDMLVVLPRELAPVVAARLSKFILRAKVKIADESEGWSVSGVIAGADATDAAGADAAAGSGSLGATTGEPGAKLDLANLPGAVGEQARVGEAVFVRVPGETARWLVMAPAGAVRAGAGAVDTGAAAGAVSDAGANPGANTGSAANWLRHDIAAGLPQVHSATSEEFVAQMLNLDVLDAIAFDKGCYTGQEVIARAHYRGRVKRRMQRFISREPRQLKPGDSGTLADGRGFKVVLAAQLDDGRCDFLAVAPFAGAAAEAAEMLATVPAPDIAGSPVTAALAGVPTAAAAAALSNIGGAAPVVPLAAEQVALPYALPE